MELFRLPADVLDSLISEGFGVTWNDDSPFTTVSDDHATEWVNGLSKSAAGLKSITQVDSATLKYVLLYKCKLKYFVNAWLYYLLEQNYFLFKLSKSITQEKHKPML